jgi:hypothetical protein
LTALRAVFITLRARLERDEDDDPDDFFADFDEGPFAFADPADDDRLADAIDFPMVLRDDFAEDFFVPPRALADDDFAPPPRLAPFDDPPFFDLPDARFAACLAMRPPFGTRILTGNQGLAKRTERYDSQSGSPGGPRRPRAGCGN